jgi:hypothetical protein
MPNIPEILRQSARIDQVWTALGGLPLRGNRGAAFWRGGRRLSVALDLRRGLWFDHAVGEGGDALALVRTVIGCDFRAAVVWLADLTGTALPDARRERSATDNEWNADLRWATYWKLASEQLAEDALELLPVGHSDRRGLTRLLRAIRAGDASLVREFRAWRRRDPQFTKAMCRAGERSNARLQRRLAQWIVSYAGTAS